MPSVVKVGSVNLYLWPSSFSKGRIQVDSFVLSVRSYIWILPIEVPISIKDSYGEHSAVTLSGLNKNHKELGLLKLYTTTKNTGS